MLTFICTVLRPDYVLFPFGTGFLDIPLDAFSLTTAPSSFSFDSCGGLSSTSTPAMNSSLIPSKLATNMHSKLAMQKWLIVDPISNQDPSSLTTQKKCRVRKSLMAITTMKSADGATPSLLFRIPRLAEIRAKGIISFKISKAPWENGSNIGISLETLSRLKAEIDATFPVLKKAD